MTFESIYGQIESKWSCKDGKICGYVKVPVNTTAEIHLPEKEEVLTVGSGVYEYEYETTTNLTYERFSMDSTMGEILAQPLAVEMFNRMVPGMADNPMLAMAHQMTLVELIGAAPEARPLYEAVVKALNEVDRQAAGAEK